ncbi:MAG: site-specific integrase, partial [Planctomycetota bacterium]|nr:site-specific integrase [Planctomycetota bacterium]
MANPRTPSYRRQAGSPHDRAFVEVGGRRIYLGRWNSPESIELYHRTIAEWLSNGQTSNDDRAQITVTEVAAAFWLHAQDHYRHPDGSLIKGSIEGYRWAIVPLKHLYGGLKAQEFGPVALRAVQQDMVRRGWARRVVNQRVNLIRAIFRWAAAREMIPATVHTALTTLESLRRGRTEAPDHPPVRPVPEHMISAIEPHVSRQVWGLVRLAVLTGARAGELVIMRSIDLDTSRDVWVYRPQAHKTQYAGRTREIFLGDKAQAVLKPFLSTRRLDAYMFSPQEAEEERRVAAAARRKTPRSYGNVRGSNRVRKPKRTPGDRYDVAAFAKAIARGCDAAFPLPAELAPRGGETLAQWRSRLTP